MKKLFSPNSLTTINRRDKNLKEILSASLFPPTLNKNESPISNRNKCNICKNYLISDNKFKCKVTGRVYSVKSSLPCNNPNVVYIISCNNCGEQYAVSVTDFKAKLRIHKSEIKTKKGRCGSSRHFSKKCCDRGNSHIFLQVQFIESVQSDVTWKVSYGKWRNIGNVSFSLIHMV